MGIITWGIGITRIELDAHCCQLVLHKISTSRSLTIVKVQKRYDLIVQTDMVQILLNVAKIQVFKINICLKAKHYLTNKKLHLPFPLNNAIIKYCTDIRMYGQQHSIEFQNSILQEYCAQHHYDDSILNRDKH